MHDSYPTSPAYRNLQPLRVPSGWRIAWNGLETDLRAEKGEFGGSTLFHPVHEGARFSLDVTFSPEFDPGGSFHLTVLYQPWPRNERGKRRKDVPFAFDGDAEEVHSFATQSFGALVAELETWIALGAGGELSEGAPASQTRMIACAAPCHQGVSQSRFTARLAAT